MAVKPLALINTEIVKEDTKNPKSASKEIKQLPVERNGTLWVEAQPNKGNWEGKYGYESDTYKLEISWATGHIDNAGHKWLVGKFKNWEELFEIKWSCKGNQKADGKYEWNDHAELEAIKQKWLEDGGLIALLVDEVPQLVMLVEAIAGKHIIFNDGGYTVYRKLNPDKAVFENVLEDIVEQANFEYQPSKRGQNPLTELHKKYLAENSWVYMCFTMEDLADVEFPEEGSPVHASLDDEGFISKVSIDWQSPEIKEKKAWNGGGGAKGQSEKEILAEREAHIFDRLGVSNIDELIQKYPSSRTKLDIVMSIALGCDWKSVSFVDYEYDNTVDVVSNGHSKANTAISTGDALPSKAAVTKAPITTPTVSSVTANTEQVESATTLKENLGELYLAKILQLQEAGTHKLPKEVDAQYLAEQGDEWCCVFYQVLQGTILDKTPYGKDARLNRGVNALISQKFGKQLYQLDVHELEALQELPEYKDAVDIDSIPM